MYTQGLVFKEGDRVTFWSKAKWAKSNTGNPVTIVSYHGRGYYKVIFENGHEELAHVRYLTRREQ